MVGIFIADYFVELRLDTDNSFITEFVDHDLGDSLASGDFSVGNTIVVTSSSFGGMALSFTYIGNFDDGWIGHRVGDVETRFVLFSNKSSVEQPVPVSYSTGAFTVCFLSGTNIATPTGECLVETLAIGDPVLGIDGRARPVRWIGRQTVVSVFADPQRNFPICVTAGALGDNTPSRDLLISPDHALLVDGLLVQASALVDGIAVRRETSLPARFTYYHIELADHALVLAEGTPAETYVDNVTRRRFDNYAEYEALHGAEAPTIPELSLPRVKSARQLPRAVRARLDARATALGSFTKVA